MNSYIKNKQLLLLIVLIASPTLMGCGEKYNIKKRMESTGENISTISDPSLIFQNAELPDGLTANVHTAAEFSDKSSEDKLVIVQVNQSEYLIKIIESDPPKSFKDWCQDENYMVVINGGFFLEDYQPTGLLITEDGTKSNSYFDKNKGMFYVTSSNEIFIKNLSFGAGDTSNMKYALQSFPILVEKQKNKIEQGQYNDIALRSFVGIDDEGKFVIGNSMSSSVTLSALSDNLIRLNLQTALNLDGGSSSGLCIRDKKGDLIHEDYSLSLIPNVIVVLKKPK